MHTAITAYSDKYGNSATIAKLNLKPYNGATFTEKAFVLSCFDGDGFMYYRNTYPTIDGAAEKLKGFSCGTFTEREAEA